MANSVLKFKMIFNTKLVKNFVLKFVTNFVLKFVTYFVLKFVTNFVLKFGGTDGRTDRLTERGAPRSDSAVA